MANLGTSVGLQGQYKNDYLDNLQLQEQKRGNLTDELFRQQEAQRKQMELAQKAMADAVSIPKGRFLPQREDELKNETISLLAFAEDKKSKNPQYNPDMDSEFQKRKIELASKAKTYETERIRAEKDVDEMVRNQSIYDPRGIEEGLAVLNGEVPFSEAMKGRLYQVPKVKDFSKFTDLDKHIYSSGVLDFVNEKRQVMENGKIKEVAYEGYDFSTPEKEKEQKLKAVEYVKSNRNDPYIQRIIGIAEKKVIENAPKEGIDLQSKPQEVVDAMVNDLAAQEIINTAKNSAYNKTKDFDKPMPRQGKGVNINNTIGGGAGIETPDGVFIFKETAMPSEGDLSMAWEKKNKEYYKTFKEKDTALNPKSDFTEEQRLERYKREVSKPSKNNPDMTIEEWNKEQLKKEMEASKKGLTAISFTPKGKDNWFKATTTDGKIRKVIPSVIYKNSNGELVSIEGYNVDESTKKDKQDLEIFKVDATNKDNRDSFIGKYPTSVKTAELNIPTKVVVSEKAKVGTISNQKSKKIVKTGTTKDGRKVVKYDDGTIEIK